MPRFFVEPFAGEKTRIVGEDGGHIARSLRMRPGDRLTLCDNIGTDYECRIDRISGDDVELTVLKRVKNQSEPDIFVTLYQGVPKSDKMDVIVQKSVELGACEIVPVLTRRCVSRPDDKSARKKQERWEKIAFEAAKQSGRGRIPTVLPMLDFEKALKTAAEHGPVLFFYEGGGESLCDLCKDLKGQKVSLFIGPEGGFAPEEAELAQRLGAKAATLGPRILRTETAPLAAIAGVMLLTGNMESGGNDHAE